ncbi:roundabout homolog 2-like isoform X3 [Tachypleus tridentatus]|uniref:roundabout homolog 2-like isoform X3 n=1 Tax=Tachypleus tridentatus TaxID=6853 RepID=UPI003FD62201
MCGVLLVCLLAIPHWSFFFSHWITVASASQRPPRITEHPNSLVVKKLEPAKLNCKADGEPTPEIEWYHNGEQIIHDTPNRMILLKGVSLFFLHVIQNKREQDTGTYWCLARNPLGEARSRNATIDLAVFRDDFRTSPKNTRVAVGETAVLECTPPRGHPEPEVSWEKDGRLISVGTGRIRMGGQGNLVIENIRQDDEGRYKCIARNMVGIRESPVAILAVNVKPFFIREPKDISTLADTNVEFACKVGGDPRPNIAWRRKDGKMPSGRAEMREDKSLRIKHVFPADEGIYICEAKNPVGSISASATLTVHSRPVFLVRPKNQRVGLNSNVQFECIATGNPPPSIFWTKEGNQVLMFPDNTYGRFSVTQEGTLAISGVTKDDRGYYLCSALSVVESAITKAYLEVTAVADLPPPVIVLGPVNQTLPQRTLAMLPCEASGTPAPHVAWFINSSPLPKDDPRYVVLDTGTLQIDSTCSLKRSDSGMYTCTASSQTGATSWSASLSVESPRNPNAIFHRMSDPSTFPGPPSKPTAVNITETAVTLTWHRNPDVGQSPLIGYNVEYYSSDLQTGWLLAAHRIHGESFVVQNLRPDTKYIFLVRAENSHGLGPPSPLSDVIRTIGLHPFILSDFDQEEARLLLSMCIIGLKDVRAINSTTVKLAWDMQCDQNYVEGFYIRFRNVNGGSRKYNMMTVLTGLASSYVLTGLQKFTKYEFFLVPFYKNVEGPPSNSRLVQTTEDVPSAPPDNLHVQLVNMTSAAIYWSPPPPQHRNGILKGYKIRVLSNNSRLHSNITTNATSTSIQIYNLIAGASYTIKALAFTSVGPGPYTSPLSVVMDPSYMESPSAAGPPSTSLSNSFQDLLRQPWFIALIGGLSCLLLSVFFVILFLRRRLAWKKALVAHLTVPVHKPEDARTDVSAHETLWINRAWRPSPHTKEQSTSETKLLNKMDYTSSDFNYSSVYSPLQCNVNASDYAEVDTHNMATFYKKEPPSALAPYATTTLINNPAPKHFNVSLKDGRSSGSEETSRKSERLMDIESFQNNEDFGFGQPLEPEKMGSPGSDSGSYTTDEYGMPIKKRLKPLQSIQKTPVVNWADLIPPPPEQPPSERGSSSGTPSLHKGFSPNNRVIKLQGQIQPVIRNPYVGRGFPSPVNSQHSSGSPRETLSHNFNENSDQAPTPPARLGVRVPGISFPFQSSYYSPNYSLNFYNLAINKAVQSSLPSLTSESHNLPRSMNRVADHPHSDDQLTLTENLYHPLNKQSGVRNNEYNVKLENTPESSDVDYAAVHGDCPSCISTTDHSNSSCTSARSSAASSSDGSFYTETDFASAIARAAQNAGYRVEGSLVTDPNPSSQRKHIPRHQPFNRPSSPYSTDSNLSTAIQPRPHHPKLKKRLQGIRVGSGPQSSLNTPSSASDQTGSYEAPLLPSGWLPISGHESMQVENLTDILPSYNKSKFPSCSSQGSNSSSRHRREQGLTLNEVQLHKAPLLPKSGSSEHNADNSRQVVNLENKITPVM